MSYMERGEEKRCDPQKVLPGAQVDCCFGAELFPGRAGKQATRLQLAGKIARYAWGDDYHDLIAE